MGDLSILVLSKAKETWNNMGVGFGVSILLTPDVANLQPKDQKGTAKSATPWDAVREQVGKKSFQALNRALCLVLSLSVGLSEGQPLEKVMVSLCIGLICFNCVKPCIYICHGNYL